MFRLRLHPYKYKIVFSSEFIPALQSTNIGAVMLQFHVKPPFIPPKLLHTLNTRPLLFIFNSSSSASNSRPNSNSNSLRRNTSRTTTNGFSHAPLPPLVSLYAERSSSQSARLNVLMNKLEALGIEGHSPFPGQYTHLLCPRCEGGASGERSLSLCISEDGNAAVWLCFRGKCGWQGSTMAKADVRLSRGMLNKTVKATKRVISEKDLGLEPICEVLVAYFAERMITAETLKRNYVMKKSIGNQMAIAFTYRRDGVLINCKYRGPEKKFWQEPGTDRILYGLDDIKNASDIIIVEGEIDKLSMEEAGFRNCVSVPDGAPAAVSEKGVPTPDEDTKYQYLWNCKEYFEKASRIILATDGDAPGKALSEELARRLGRERCWRVKWPKKNKLEEFKDANEVLMYLGPEKLKETVDNAELYPIQGLFAFKDYFHEIDAYYDSVLGDELGVSTGWRCLDEYYNVVPGELTVVTGVPNSGKSEWIDALLCNLNQSVGWKFALCSMENKVREHARKLLEKHVKKPFFGVRYAESIERMTREDLELGKKWLDDTFHLIRCENDSLPSIKWVIDLAKAAVLRHGVRGLVIDPYNELDHQRHNSMTETEYVSQILTLVKRFAQHYSCHVWFVAHPRQLHNWVGNAPNLYDISGSAHFINKCDNGIIIHRNRDPDAGPIDSVQICIRKVRNKVAGTIGDAHLSYNRITGEYSDYHS